MTWKPIQEIFTAPEREEFGLTIQDIDTALSNREDPEEDNRYDDEVPYDPCCLPIRTGYTEEEQEIIDKQRGRL